MKSSPDKRHGNRRPEIWVERSGASAYPSSGKLVTEHTRNPPLWSKLLPLLHFQQLPYISHPFFQLGNIGIVEMPGAVDATANLVDVRDETADK